MTKKPKIKSFNRFQIRPILICNPVAHQPYDYIQINWKHVLNHFGHFGWCGEFSVGRSGLGHFCLISGLLNVGSESCTSKIVSSEKPQTLNETLLLKRGREEMIEL